MEAVLAFLPDEQRVQYSAMTGQSLFYMGESDLKHKVLAIVEEEGVHSAAYALKLLQSEGVLTIASTGKDPNTGRHVTHQYRVEGPVMIFLTTTAIRSVALLHQHQRPHKTVEHRGRTVEYIEVALADIAMANRLAHEVLGRSLDELPPQTRRLLLAVDEMVTAECERAAMERSDYRFSRRDVREFTGWGDTQLKTHLHRLEELEYLLVHRGGRGQSIVYELVFTRPKDGGKPVLGGLIDVDKLSKNGYDGKKSGPEGE
jgi:hypothetical protein